MNEINKLPSIFELLCNFNFCESQVCDFCLSKFERISKMHCLTCNKNGKFKNKICEDCQYWKKEFDIEVHHTAWYAYNQFMHDYFRRYKRNGDIELAKVFQQEIASNNFFRKFDIITYIPMTVSHMEQRGFNPIKELFSELPLEILFSIIRDTGAQAMKNRRERLTTPQKFELIKEINPKQKILIVDDIYTTGRTLSHACQCLLKKYPNIKVETFSLVR